MELQKRARGKEIKMDLNLLMTEAVAHIDVIVGGNEFASGAIIAGLLGMITYLMRAIPARIISLTVKHTTTTMVLDNTNESYYHLAKYLHDNGFTNRSRYIKIANGRYGNNDKSLKQLGYGQQLFWVNWYTPMMVDIHKESSQSNNIKEFISLRKFGRSHKYFDQMITDMEKENEDYSNTKFFHYKDQYQRFIGNQPKRRMDTISLPSETLKKLTNAIDSFTDKEEWYLKHQIPYQLGILLYGPPGTGKTSLIKAIAMYMDKNVCMVDTEYDLASAAMDVNDSIIAVEEVDTMGLKNRKTSTPSRGEDAPVDEDEDVDFGDIVKSTKNDPIEEMFDVMDRKSLGKILNALDGVISNHGRVIILTTNHEKTLDPALLRPGRIDLKLEIGFMCSETFNDMLKKFFPDFEKRDVDIKPNLSPSVLQNDIILGFTPEELLDKHTNKLKLVVNENTK